MKKFICIIICTLIGVIYTLADKTHIIQRGESIESISQIYNISKNELIEANPGIESLFYVGLKLNIPESKSSSLNTSTFNLNSESNSVKDIPVNSITGNDYQYRSNNTSSGQTDSFEDSRKDGAVEIGYSAESFKYAKGSGSYGLSWTSLPWEIAPRLYAGCHFSPFNFNFGLVDSDYTSDVIKLGPALGYYFTPQIFLAMPLDVDCTVCFSGSKTRTFWGMALAPCIYFGAKYGIYLGPQFSLTFIDGSNINCGFRIGFYL